MSRLSSNSHCRFLTPPADGTHVEEGEAQTAGGLGVVPSYEAVKWHVLSSCCGSFLCNAWLAFITTLLQLVLVQSALQKKISLGACRQTRVSVVE